MKKTMILALAVLGMVLGSFAIVTPVKAQGGPCGPSIESGDAQLNSVENAFTSRVQVEIAFNANLLSMNL